MPDSSLPAIRHVLAQYRSTSKGLITKEEITAAWAEFDALREVISVLDGKPSSVKPESRYRQGFVDGRRIGHTDAVLAVMNREAAKVIEEAEPGFAHLRLSDWLRGGVLIGVREQGAEPRTEPTDG